MAATGTTTTISRSTAIGGAATIAGATITGTTGAIWASWNNRPFFWWDWCSAPVLTTWCGFSWGTPYYWDYGPGEYINCYNDVIYVNGRWFEPAPLYYRQTVLLAQSAPDLTPEQALQAEWLPLGVFAVSRDGVVDNNTLVQLAVTKEGVIGGTVHEPDDRQDVRRRRHGRQAIAAGRVDVQGRDRQARSRWKRASTT